jgi:hypothetical protein
MEERSIYRGKNLIWKNVLLRVIENSSCRNSSCGRNIPWKIYEFFSGNMNSIRVMENSSYRRSSYRSSTVFINLCVQSGVIVYPASYPMGIAGSFPGALKLTTHIPLVPRLNCMELYLHCRIS